MTFGALLSRQNRERAIARAAQDRVDEAQRLAAAEDERRAREADAFSRGMAGLSRPGARAQAPVDEFEDDEQPDGDSRRAAFVDGMADAEAKRAARQERRRQAEGVYLSRGVAPELARELGRQDVVRAAFERAMTNMSEDVSEVGGIMRNAAEDAVEADRAERGDWTPRERQVATRAAGAEGFAERMKQLAAEHGHFGGGSAA